ncbi:MAG: phosphoribosylglycinamide synthetase C domain-containing protein, partial [Limosilactobacillus fermentum]|nr:phosphoribosylglycinamide synthetase C domain-containing protein [Limosilactobacillus fermentum]
ETQVILPRLATDLFDLVDACVNDQPLPEVVEKEDAVLGVVVAAKGYPQKPVKNQALGKFPVAGNITVDYANVAGSLADLHGAGGRLLMVIATASDLKQAQQDVYAYLDQLEEPECFWRQDIGEKAFK